MSFTAENERGRNLPVKIFTVVSSSYNFLLVQYLILFAFLYILCLLRLSQTSHEFCKALENNYDKIFSHYKILHLAPTSESVFCGLSQEVCILNTQGKSFFNFSSVKLLLI